MKQIILIHGGDTFENYDEYLDFLRDFPIDFENIKKHRRWKDWLSDQLGADYEVIAPEMPNKFNAKYVEWKMWFEKLVPFFNPELILVGHSLGGIFLAKYLSENELSKKIKALFLLAAPFDVLDSDYSLADFNLSSSLERLAQCEQIFLYQSSDDDVVPPVDVEKYKKALPQAKLKIFNDRGHFSQVEFPELLEDIQNIVF